MIRVPTLLLDEQKCRRNIKMMADRARRNNVVFRPHFKTHASHETGRWFRDEGVEKITVSSMRMAQYFAEDEWKDILVAFPVNVLESDLINKLAGDINLSLLVESVEVVEFLSENLTSPAGAYIKTDTGLKRTGVPHKDIGRISEIIDAITGQEMISFKGFLTHAGQSYRAVSRDEISKIHYETIKAMLELRSHFAGRFSGIIVSVGDTPTCSIMEDFSMVDEIRPGNFVFFDLTQLLLGSCSSGEIAVAMACPVVATHPERNEIVVYGGSVHFSGERVSDVDGRSIFGVVVQNEGNGWGDIIKGARLTRLSQEHGIIEAPPEFVRSHKPGDIIKVIPAHSCITASLMKEYLTTEGRLITRL